MFRKLWALYNTTAHFWITGGKFWRNVLKDKCLLHLLLNTFRFIIKKENTFIINDFWHIYDSFPKSHYKKGTPPFFLAEDMYTISKLQISL